MNFEKLYDISGNSGFITSIGICSMGGKKFKCIEKMYTNRGYEKTLGILTKYKDFIKDIGPEVYFKDTENKKIYMECIECQPVKSFVTKINLDIEPDRANFFNLMTSIEKLMTKMEIENVCHNDLHESNILVCSDMSLRLIDMDTLSERGNGNLLYRCRDTNNLISGIVRTMETQLELKNKDGVLKLKGRSNSEKEILQKIFVMLSPKELEKYLK